MKHVYIIDPKPFRGQQWKMDGLLDSIGQYFRTQDKPNFSTLVSYSPRSALSLIQKQVEEAEEGETVRVYAIGGDDMLFDCLNGIAELPNMELAAVPQGTVNTFIRAFGEGKAELFRDIPALAQSSTIPTDIIEVGNNCAINGCSVGFTPATALKREEIRTKLERGFSRFFIDFWFFVYNFTSLFDKELTGAHYTVTIDGKDYSGNYTLIDLINSPYFGTSKAPLKGVSPDNGFMDVVLFKSVGPLSTLASFRKFSKGKLPTNCVRIQAHKVEIRADKPMFIQTDSELLSDTSITFEVVPGAVQFVTVNNLTYQGF